MNPNHDPDRAFWLEVRRARLLEVKAIEARLKTQTVTVTLKREEAEKLGVVDSTK
jgi:hypothetical protein